MTSNNSDSYQIKTNSWYLFRLFSIFTVVFITIVSSIILLVYTLEKENEKINALSLEKHRLEMAESQVEGIFSTIVSDYIIVRDRLIFEEEHDNEKIQKIDYHDEGEKDVANHLTHDLIAVIKSKIFYDRITLFDKSGIEMVKVDYNNGNPIVLDDDNVVYENINYIKKAAKLHNERIFVLPMNLKNNNGIIDIPTQPIIRFGFPIYRDNKEFFGLIVFDYLANNMFKDLAMLYKHNNKIVSVLNSDGYWLKADNPELEWGHILDGRQANNFKNFFPKIWEKMEKGENDQLETKQGIYSYTTIHPSSLVVKKLAVLAGGADVFLPADLDNYWQIFSFTQNSELNKQSLELLKKMVILGSVLSLIVLTMLFFMVRAVAKRRAAEKMVFRLNDLLKVINKILRHDMLGKLTVIRLYIDSYRSNKNDKDLDVVANSAISGIELISQMRKLESLATTQNTFSKIDLRKLFESIIKEYQIPINIKGEGVVLADEALRSVFDNIIRNAIMHGSTDKMEISIQVQKKNIKIEMADFGKGIPNEIRDKIFEEGFKYGDTGNSGLGLYIVKKTIERYSGEITVEPNNPKGAIFVIKLSRALK